LGPSPRWVGARCCRFARRLSHKVRADPWSEITGSREPLEKEEPSVLWGRSVFMPAVRDEINQLVAACGADEFELDLR
jgi:hypothetical protein